ncbi:hypothetical protein IBTHAUMO2_590065 [Nitrosopumilaceae archaeon]|nr:hypothetical protein [Nitrosopumilus sp.]CAI9832124.1 hypothetical protein IBTHAUMO2_590065 [Nitrosopumilaceae archaeon]MDA7945072.1 hypothetical protein [Nitrosopumilus sp.]MDA7954461.1 hypothetical protein [Nitrosopumilus sp.]MDA7973584.1 hypothetical protein [Nitrosopumilus sp.]
MSEDAVIPFVQTVIGGAVAGASAVITYRITRRWFRSGEKKDVSSILLDEVMAMPDFAQFFDKTVSGRRRPRIPSDSIYRGLLHTGNIRYLDPGTRGDLALLYEDFAHDRFSLDMDLLKKVVASLEASAGRS